MYLPRFIWLSFNSRYGVNLKNLVDAAKKYETVEGSDNREKILVYICKNLLRSIQFKDYRRSGNTHRQDDSSSFLNDSYLTNQKELNKMLTMSSSSVGPLNTTTSNISSQMTLTTPFTIYEEELKLRNNNNSSKSQVRLSKQDTDLFTAYAKIDNSSKSAFKPRHESAELLRENMSLNILRSRINTLSRKHLLNVFTTGYETSNQSSKQLDEEDQLRAAAAAADEKATGCLAKLKSFSFLPDLNKNYLSYLYIFVKLCYLLSSVGQVFILNRLIGQNFYKLGINLIISFLTDDEWPQLAIFPRISLCEIYIREIGTVHPYLIQCVLRINLFNELIFILVWFWLLFVITMTAIDLMTRFFYTCLSCSNCQRKLFALKYLELIHLNATAKLFSQPDSAYRTQRVDHILIEQEATRPDNPKSEYDNNANKREQSRYVLVKADRAEEFDLFERFCDKNFTSDSVFALHIIQQNASNLIVSEIIEYLWRQFKLLNFVYSNETNDFFLKRIITHHHHHHHRHQQQSASETTQQQQPPQHSLKEPPKKSRKKEKRFQ